MKSELTFLRGALQQFKNTGSICPTSRFAAEAMLSGLLDSDKRILEVGPGTGSITKHILKRLAKTIRWGEQSTQLKQGSHQDAQSSN